MVSLFTATPFFKRRSAGPAKRKQKAFAPPLGASLRLGMPSLRPSWLMGFPDQKQKRGGLKADLTFTGVPGSPVGASWLRGVDRSHALRGNAARDAPRSSDDALIEPCATVMRGVTGSYVRFIVGVHIHWCGNGHLWFRPYGDSLFQTPKRKQKALPHHSVPR
jgi:hypothetical protein